MRVTERHLEKCPWLKSRRGVENRLYWWAVQVTRDLFQNACNPLALLDFTWQLLWELRLIDSIQAYRDLLNWEGEGENASTARPSNHPLFVVAMQKVVSLTPLDEDLSLGTGTPWYTGYEMCHNVVGSIAHAEGCDGNCDDGMNGIACLDLKPHRHHRESIL